MENRQIGTGATPRWLTRHLVTSRSRKLAVYVETYELIRALQFAIEDIAVFVEEYGGRGRARSCQVGYTQVALALRTGGALKIEKDRRNKCRNGGL